MCALVCVGDLEVGDVRDSNPDILHGLKASDSALGNRSSHL